MSFPSGRIDVKGVQESRKPCIDVLLRPFLGKRILEGVQHRPHCCCSTHNRLGVFPSLFLCPFPSCWCPCPPLLDFFFLCFSSTGIGGPLPRFLISLGCLRLGLQRGGSTLDVVLCNGLRGGEQLSLRAVGQPGVCREVHLFCPEVGILEKFPEQRLPGVVWVPHCGCFSPQSDFHLCRDLQPQHML